MSRTRSGANSSRVPRAVHWGTIPRALLYGAGTARRTEHSYSYTIRFLTERDIESVHRLQTSVLSVLPRPLPMYERDLGFFARCVADRGCIIGALDGDALIGYATLFVPGAGDVNYGADLGLPDAELRRVAHLAGSATHPEYRGNGLQAHLVAMRGDFARQKGYHHLCGEVVPGNAVSMHNHFLNGYFLRGFRIDCFGLPNFILHKDLRRNPRLLGESDFPETAADDVTRYRQQLQSGRWGFRVIRQTGRPRIAYARFS